MKITEKGQVTIPQDIRLRYGLLPHTEVKFVAEKGRVYLIKTEGKTKLEHNIIERLRGTAKGHMSTDELMALTRGEPNKDE